MIEKPFIPPNPDSHLISPVSGHQLFKGSSLAKSTAEIVADIFVLQQSWESSTPEPNKRAITQHSQQPMGGSVISTR